jgi:hypothetical protein
LTTPYGIRDTSLADSSKLEPIKRLIEEIVLVGLVMACLLAGSPTLRSPPSTNATTEGVVRFPSELAMTTGSLPSMTETKGFVVPRSIPIIFPILNYFLILCLSQGLCHPIKQLIL